MNWRYDILWLSYSLTSLILKEKNLSFNENEYESELEKQKSRSRSASDMKTEDWVVINKTASSIFRGYDKVSLKTKINKYRKVFNKDNKFFQVVLHETPFLSRGRWSNWRFWIF